MAQKRKMDHKYDDLKENEKNVHYCFQNVANSLSQLYTKSMDHQKLAFQAGQKYAYVKLHEWMLEKLQDGKMVTVSEILIYLQGELKSDESDEDPAGEGTSGAGQDDEVATLPLSAQAGQNQNINYLDTQMDFTSDHGN
ncbi:hypothetical protein CASFOL_039770 [Castilleja foliolosa]|uniref:Uncharacterized protein n=1 Tax=Castilleja foliolosa TaxID=1961234 RepID=A0ABD3BG54_9LAMI